MFLFRSRRSQLVARLARLDNAQDGERERRRLGGLLKELELGQLESLVVALETDQCCSLPGEGWLVRQWRWPTSSSQDSLVRLPTCPTSDCSNPSHWARLATPGILTGVV